jgi:hypothetical protein
MAIKKYYTIPHPRCNEIHIKIPKKDEGVTIIDNSQTLTVQTLYSDQLSINTQRILKKTQTRSYYRASQLISSISNQSERNFLLQFLISISACLQNNYDANIAKIWIDSISIQDYIKSNTLSNSTKRTTKAQCSHLLEINLGVTSQLLINEDEVNL